MQIGGQDEYKTNLEKGTWKIRFPVPIVRNMACSCRFPAREGLLRAQFSEGSEWVAYRIERNLAYGRQSVRGTVLLWMRRHGKNTILVVYLRRKTITSG